MAKKEAVAVRVLVLVDLHSLGLKCGQVADVPEAIAKAHADALDKTPEAVAAAGVAEAAVVSRMPKQPAPAADGVGDQDDAKG